MRWRLCGLAATAMAIGLAPKDARADDADVIVSPRAIGRAGASVVAEDGSPALLINPAGMARRSSSRATAGIVVAAPSRSFEAAASPDAPTIHDRGAATGAPSVGAQAGMGDVVIGAAFLQAPGHAATLPAPGFGADPEDVARLYPHRYAGLGLTSSRRSVALGVAWRALPWLAIGATATAADVAVEESRAIWAGVAGRDTPGDPRGDLTLALSGRDRFVPGAAAGFLAAPVDLPIELAASVQASARASLRGEAALRRTRDQPYPEPRLAEPRASLALPSTLVARAGARYLGERWAVELGADLRRERGDAGAWTLTGVAAANEVGDVGALTGVPAAHIPTTRGAVRAALDVAVIPGFAWLTGGYAYASRGIDKAEFRPTFAAPATHTAALGLESGWDNVSVALGYARSMSRRLDLTGSTAGIDSPFTDAGTGAADGSYRVADHRVSFSLDVTWP